MKHLLALALLLAVAACGDRPQSVGTKVVYQEVVKEVPRPCPVRKPELPKPLARPLPTEAARLVDLLTAKLKEWAGPGGYGERADAALDTCIKP